MPIFACIDLPQEAYILSSQPPSKFNLSFLALTEIDPFFSLKILTTYKCQSPYLSLIPQLDLMLIICRLSIYITKSINKPIKHLISSR